METTSDPVDERADHERQEPGEEADDYDPAEGACDRHEPLDDQGNKDRRPGGEEDCRQAAKTPGRAQIDRPKTGQTKLGNRALNLVMGRLRR